MGRFSVLIILLIFGVTFCFGEGAKKSIIKFDNKVYKFDTITLGDRAVSHEFVFENRGEVPLIILSSSISCKCTKVKYSKKPLLPGMKDSIKVTFNPKGLSAGVFTKNIKIISNAEGAREILTIMGVIEQR